LKHQHYKRNTAGFSLIELVIAMTIMLIALGLVSMLFAKSMNTRTRESSRTDALTAAQAALNVISREIANSGYGIAGNGIVVADSTNQQLHFQSNIQNNNTVFTDPGENLTYYFDQTTQSILRHDANGGGVNTSQTSTIVNRISSLAFEYFDYVGTNPPVGPNPTPTVNTSRIRVTVSVLLEQVQGQGNPQSVVLVSDVALRNSDYMLRQY
jgi:prepilin-type N-terminal cleavage/methylation domain-containing protein